MSDAGLLSTLDLISWEYWAKSGGCGVEMDSAIPIRHVWKGSNALQKWTLRLEAMTPEASKHLFD